MLEIITKVTANPAVKNAAKIAYSKAPTAMLVAGVGCVLGGVVLTAAKSMKANAEIENAKTFDAILDNNDSELEGEEHEKALVKSKRMNHLHCLKELAYIYAVPAALVTSGIGLIIGAHHVQARRIALLSTTYNALLTGFNEYRARVIAEQGFEKDQLYFGATEHEIEKTTVNKNGKKTTRKGSVTCPGSGDSESLYHRCFDEYNSMQWKKDNAYNLAFLLAQERIFNNQLHAHGYVFLDEVYQQLGFDLREYSNAKMVGWLDDGTGDSFIDFGIFNPEQPENMQFVDGFEPAIWLNFNCDGVIIDRV